ncbi:MAG: YddF family protein [candidate division KSB1 bacterium]|nr:YddF family protein [candidate division KSB1 bacterium]
MKPPLLIANAFPFSLIYRRVLIEPIEIERAKQLIFERGYESSWGHENTLKAVNSLLGVDLTPKEPRPALVLNEEMLPALYGAAFSEVLLVTPIYRQGFRPTIGEEVQADAVLGWRTLLMQFL